MNSLGGAPELLRHGIATFNGEVVYDGFIDRAIVAQLNAHYLAVGLRISSTPLQIKNLPPVPDFADESETVAEVLPVKQKPHLRIVK